MAALPVTARASNGASPGSTATGPIIRAAGPPGPDFRARLRRPGYRQPTRQHFSPFIILFLKCSGCLLGSRGLSVEGRRHVAFCAGPDFQVFALVGAAG